MSYLDIGPMEDVDHESRHTLKNLPDVPAEGAAERTTGPTGPVSRTRQTIVEPGDSKNFNCSVVNFS